MAENATPAPSNLPSPESLAARHETREPSGLALLGVGLGWMIFLVLLLFGLRGLERAFAPATPMGLRPAALPQAWPAPVHDSFRAAAPALVTHPRAELADFRAREEAGRPRHRWVDREQGLAEIPLERAMELVAEKGLPPWHGEDP